MATTPIFHGRWTDYSYNTVFGSSYTTSTFSGTVFTNAVALFIGTFVAGAVWSMTQFILHQYRPFKFTQQEDAVNAQHRLIWRNDSDPLRASWEALSLYWSYKSYKDHRNRPINPPIAYFKTRTLCAIILPFALWVFLFAASLFSATLVLSGSRGSHVLIKRGALGSCGVWDFNTTVGGLYNSQERLRHYISKVLKDTLSGRNYARSCYSQDFTSVNPVSCDFYVVQKLSYMSQPLKGYCPFGDGLLFEHSPCNSINNTGSYHMWSKMLDSNDDFGINAPFGNRVFYQKNVTCSVINPEPYAMATEGPGTTSLNVTGYYLGGYANAFDYYSFDTNYTYFYEPVVIDANVGYQITSVIRFANFPDDWIAFPEFRRADGDTSVHFFAANSVTYTGPVGDPFFLATAPKSAAPGSHLETVYFPDNPVSIMGCVDQYRICKPLWENNPQKDCTKISGSADLSTNIMHLGLTPAQNVTAQRLVALSRNTNTLTNLYGTGADALKASDDVLDFLSSPLPSNQWIIEVEGWFETGLAKMQAYAVEFATNSLHLAPFEVVDFPGVDEKTRLQWESQCENQKIANPGSNVTISFFGLLFTFLCGGAIWLIGFNFEWIVGKCRKCHRNRSEPSRNRLERRECTYLADSKYLLHDMALNNTMGEQNIAYRKDVAIFLDNPSLPYPEKQQIGNSTRLRYISPLPTSNARNTTPSQTSNAGNTTPSHTSNARNTTPSHISSGGNTTPTHASIAGNAAPLHVSTAGNTTPTHISSGGNTTPTDPAVAGTTAT